MKNSALTKELKFEFYKVIGASSCGRFIQLENGSVIDSKTQKVTVLKPLVAVGDFYVTHGGYKFVISQEQFDGMFHIPQANFDIAEIEAQISNFEFVHTNNLTVCTIEIGNVYSVCGDFTVIPGANVSLGEAEQAAYYNAFNKLMTYHTIQRIKQMNALKAD